MKESKREIWVGKSRVHLRDDDILHFTIVGNQDEKTAIEFKEASDRLKAMVEGKVDVLIDLDCVGKPSLKGRRKAYEAFKSEKFGKIAFYGLNPVARVVASFVMGVSQKKKMRFFNSMEEALEWLKE